MRLLFESDSEISSMYEHMFTCPHVQAATNLSRSMSDFQQT